MSTKSTHSYLDNPKNNTIKIYINGSFYKRKDAKISIMDSGFLLGDGIWESFRLHNGHLCFIDEHLNRLYDNAKRTFINIDKSKSELLHLI